MINNQIVMQINEDICFLKKYYIRLNDFVIENESQQRKCVY